MTTVREGSLEAPTRHPIDWKNADFWSDAALEKEGLTVLAVPSIETRFDLEDLHWPGDRREAFAAIAHERLGLVYYRRKGWIE